MNQYSLNAVLSLEAYSHKSWMSFKDSLYLGHSEFRTAGDVRAYLWFLLCDQCTEFYFKRLEEKGEVSRLSWHSFLMKFIPDFDQAVRFTEFLVRNGIIEEYLVRTGAPFIRFVIDEDQSL